MYKIKKVNVEKNGKNLRMSIKEKVESSWTTFQMRQNKKRLKINKVTDEMTKF